MKFRIREAREKVGLTQAQLAKQLGLNEVTLSGYELGKHDPKSNTLALIAQICGTSVDFLLGREEEPPKREQTSITTGDEDKLLGNYRKLNPDGKQMAFGMVESLTLNPAFTQDTSSAAG